MRFIIFYPIASFWSLVHFSLASHCCIVPFHRELNLENNALCTRGCIGLITGFNNLRSSTFQELNISSNQIGEALAEGDIQILHALAQQFKACITLKKISFHGNFFADKVSSFICLDIV